VTQLLTRRSAVCAAVCAAVLLVTPGTWAQQTTDPYKPTVGMAGKDAVWVPTTEAMVEKMLDMAKVTPQDFVMDLGSGDGRMIVAAAKRGARALGVEYNPDLVEYSKQQAAKAGVSDKASFAQGDMYAADISRATVLALFLLPSNLEKLTAKFLDLKPGSRIVANTFWVQGWEPDEKEVMPDHCDNWCTSLLFIIPAKVAGRWRTSQGDLSLTQQYQMVDGTLAAGSGTATTVKGRLRGTQITMTIGGAEYQGTVNGDSMELSSKSGTPSRLTATRVS